MGQPVIREYQGIPWLTSTLHRLHSRKVKYILFLLPYCVLRNSGLEQHNENRTFNLGEYLCTDMHCKWEDFTHMWGFYLDNGKNITNLSVDINGNNVTECTKCQNRCSSDSDCGAFECSPNYCSYWKIGICSKITDATFTNANYYTCRKPGSFVLKNIATSQIHKFYEKSLCFI